MWEGEGRGAIQGNWACTPEVGAHMLVAEWQNGQRASEALALKSLAPREHSATVAEGCGRMPPRAPRGSARGKEPRPATPAPAFRQLSRSEGTSAARQRGLAQPTGWWVGC